MTGLRRFGIALLALGGVALAFELSLESLQAFPVTHLEGNFQAPITVTKPAALRFATASLWPYGGLPRNAVLLKSWRDRGIALSSGSDETEGYDYEWIPGAPAQDRYDILVSVISDTVRRCSDGTTLPFFRRGRLPPPICSDYTASYPLRASIFKSGWAPDWWIRLSWLRPRIVVPIPTRLAWWCRGGVPGDRAAALRVAAAIGGLAKDALRPQPLFEPRLHSLGGVILDFGDAAYRPFREFGWIDRQLRFDELAVIGEGRTRELYAHGVVTKPDEAIRKKATRASGWVELFGNDYEPVCPSQPQALPTTSPRPALDGLADLTVDAEARADAEERYRRGDDLPPSVTWSTLASHSGHDPDRNVAVETLTSSTDGHASWHARYRYRMDGDGYALVDAHFTAK